MAVSSIDAGKTICELSKWQTSNLRLQKLLYIAHLYCVGIKKEDLIREDFYAWKLGPVEPDLYEYCKVYGSSPIGRIFPKNGGVDKQKNKNGFKAIKKVVEVFGNAPIVELVNFTHWKGGAWHEVYNIQGKPNFIIPHHLIIKEHENRLKESREKEGNHG